MNKQIPAIAKHFSIKPQKMNLTENPSKASKQRMKLCSIRRAVPIKFGISFTIPDRIATEINDKKSISGLHPLRIIRIPCGGPLEFHQIVKEAHKVSPPLKIQLQAKPPNPKAEYHRSRLNHWHPQVFHFNANKINSSRDRSLCPWFICHKFKSTYPKLLLNSEKDM